MIYANTKIISALLVSARTSLLYLWCACLLIAIMCGRSEADPNWNAKLMELKRTWDTTIKTEFQFKNTGIDLLHIDKVKTSCGCVTAEADKKDYQSGEKGTIFVKLDASDSYGPLEKTIAIIGTDSKGKFESVLTIKVPALDLVKADTSQIVWHKGDKLDDQKIKVHFYPKTNILIDHLVVSDPRITTDFTFDPDDASAEITLHTLDTATSLKASLTVFTTLSENGKQKTLIIPIVLER